MELDSESLASLEIDAKLYTWKIKAGDINNPGEKKNLVLVSSIPQDRTCGGLVRKSPPSAAT